MVVVSYEAAPAFDSALPVREIIGGYYRQVGVVWNGGRSLATLTPQASVADAAR